MPVEFGQHRWQVLWWEQVRAGRSPCLQGAYGLSCSTLSSPSFIISSIYLVHILYHISCIHPKFLEQPGQASPPLFYWWETLPREFKGLPHGHTGGMGMTGFITCADSSICHCHPKGEHMTRTGGLLSMLSTFSSSSLSSCSQAAWNALSFHTSACADASHSSSVSASDISFLEPFLPHSSSWACDNVGLSTLM